MIAALSRPRRRRVRVVTVLALDVAARAADRPVVRGCPLQRVVDASRPLDRVVPRIGRGVRELVEDELAPRAHRRLVVVVLACHGLGRATARRRVGRPAVAAEAEILRQFPSDDKFLQEGFSSRAAFFLHLQRYPQRG